MSINNQSTDYSLTNIQLYTPALLAKQAYKLFITIPHTDIDKDELLALIQAYKQVIFCKICVEHHEDGDTHLHLVMSFKQQVKYNQIHKILIKASEGKRIIGCVNYQIPKNFDAVSQYLNKEGDVCQFGEQPLVIGKPQQGDVCRATLGFKEAVELARQGNIEEAKDILLAHQPRDMLINGGNIVDNLKILNQTRKKFEVPTYNTDNTQLRDWQIQLLNLVKSTPQTRRIIWIHGEPETGKSFMFNYLGNLENYEYGIYNAGQCVSMDNLVYGYDEEGIIAWDFPMNFQFNDTNNSLQGHIANVIEKFSDFGQSISSKKYKGSNKTIRGHCVVFSNRPPLDELRHRDIITIEAFKESKRKPNKVNEVNKVNKVNEVNKVESIKIESYQDLEKVNKVSPSGDVEELEIETATNTILEQPKDIETKMKIKVSALINRLRFLKEHSLNYDEQMRIKDKLKTMDIEITRSFQDSLTEVGCHMA